MDFGVKLNDLLVWEKHFWLKIIQTLKLIVNNDLSLLNQRPGPRLNINPVFPRYGDSRVKDKTVAVPSYL